ncbi:MAG TPA: hypothetical protein VG759_11355 [Candidatus Angelobacter sp.]|jgi:hypothetical protein|nr:hypothetical protein [Candidatus Angelobacter sp.]
MKRQLFANSIVAVLVAFTLALPVAMSAQTNNGSTQGKTNNNPANRLGQLELTMQQSIGKDAKAFGRAQGEYWGIVSTQGDFPRAYNFFSNLAASHPSSPDVLGLEGSAIGGYIGWLYSPAAGKPADEQLVVALDSKARASFDKALQIDANNFNALLGYAIYESYNPTGAEHSKELFARLESLRSSHPEYPWNVVDEFKRGRASGK